MLCNCDHGLILHDFDKEKRDAAASLLKSSLTVLGALHEATAPPFGLALRTTTVFRGATATHLVATAVTDSPELSSTDMALASFVF